MELDQSWLYREVIFPKAEKKTIKKYNKYIKYKVLYLKLTY